MSDVRVLSHDEEVRAAALRGAVELAYGLNARRMDGTAPAGTDDVLRAARRFETYIRTGDTGETT